MRPEFQELARAGEEWTVEEIHAYQAKHLRATLIHAANFCPYFTRDGKRILFASNVNAEGFAFDLWLVGKDGSGLERVTTAPGFDGFPVFSPDGEFVVWASSRDKPEGHEMNLFIAKWERVLGVSVAGFFVQRMKTK